jgi:hypothetical protein
MEPVQVVQNQVDAFNARDVDAFVACYSPDAVLMDGSGTVLAQGQEALTALYGQLFSQSPNLHADISNRIHVGSWVVEEEQTTGFIFEGFPPDVHSIVVYQVENDKIVKSTLLI